MSVRLANNVIAGQGEILYTTTGQHEDGCMTQKATTNQLTSVNNSAVHLTGTETITGIKTVTSNGNTFTGMSSPIVFKNNNLEQLTVPSSYSEQMLFCTDKNGVRIANYGGGMNTSGESRSYIAASKLINGAYKYSIVDAYVATDGTRRVSIDADTFTFPRCTSKATTTSSASSSKVAVIIANYKNGKNYYRKWSDGWIEQGGWFSSTAAGDSYVTVNLLISFSDTNYVVINQHEQSAYTGNWGSGCASIHSTNRTVSTFELSVDGCTNTTGYFWYACGY